MGSVVTARTVKALLTPSALRRFEAGDYRFCADSACAVVYFDGFGRCFETSDIRVPVSQKEPDGARVICYCFDETEASIRAEIAETGASHAVKRVRDHIAAGRCACDLRNPRGTCCLGDLQAAVERLTPAPDA